VRQDLQRKIMMNQLKNEKPQTAQSPVAVEEG
jgi:hypothetical protein